MTFFLNVSQPVTLVTTRNHCHHVGDDALNHNYAAVASDLYSKKMAVQGKLKRGFIVMLELLVDLLERAKEMVCMEHHTEILEAMDRVQVLRDDLETITRNEADRKKSNHESDAVPENHTTAKEEHTVSQEQDTDHFAQ